MSKLWDETIEMMKDSCRRGAEKPIEQKFKALDPQLAIDYMKADPGPKTIAELMSALNGKKSSVRRIMVHLADIGAVKIDDASQKNIHLYSLIGD